MATYGRQNKQYGYVRSGPKAGGSYYQTVQTMQNQGQRGSVNAALNARSEGLNQKYGIGDYAAKAKPAVAPPQAPPQAPGGGQPQAPTIPAYSYDSDPILQKIRAMASGMTGNAEAQALSAKRQAAIDFGDEGFARNVLGDENTAKAAADNPFGVRQQLARQHEQQVDELDENLNQRNLYFSGARANALGEATRDYQGQLAGATGEFQGLLGDIEGSLMAALTEARDREIQGEEDAAGRALELALSSGVDPGQGQGEDAQLPGAAAAPTGNTGGLLDALVGGGLTAAPDALNKRRKLEGLLF